MMGGSGGYFSGHVDPADLTRKAREAEEKSKDESFETEVNEFLAKQLAQYNDRDVDDINSVLDRVKKDLEREVEGTVDLLFGGSIDKHTYVNGLSDVDSLVLMDHAEIRDKSPAELKGVLAHCLRTRYGADVVSEGTLAVTLTVGEKMIQLLPAMRSGEGFKIASSDGKGWSQVHPRNFAKALTARNQEMGRKLVPTIKLAKACIAKLPEQRRISGYHTESLAIKVFKNYDGPKTHKAMLRHFFEEGATAVRQPVTDSSGQSVHVDEYLGGSNSLQRRIVSDAFARIARRMRNADGAQSLEMWRDALG